MSADCFRRGMVLQFEEIESGATFCIGNVHLPARPSAIEGRLKTLSTAIKKTESCEPIKKVSALDGLVLIAGGALWIVIISIFCLKPLFIYLSIEYS